VDGIFFAAVGPGGVRPESSATPRGSAGQTWDHARVGISDRGVNFQEFIDAPAAPSGSGPFPRSMLTPSWPGMKSVRVENPPDRARAGIDRLEPLAAVSPRPSSITVHLQPGLFFVFIDIRVMGPAFVQLGRVVDDQRFITEVLVISPYMPAAECRNPPGWPRLIFRR